VRAVSCGGQRTARPTLIGVHRGGRPTIIAQNKITSALSVISVVNL